MGLANNRYYSRKLANNQKDNTDTEYINVKVKDIWNDNKHYVNPSKNSGSTVIFSDYITFLRDAEVYKDAKKSDFDNLYNFLAPYGRISNSSVLITEQALAKLDNADFAKMTSCGLSAIRTVLMAYTKTGDHIIVSDGIYGPTSRFITEILQQYGIKCSFFDPLNAASIEKMILPETRLIYLESPCSSLFEVINVEQVVNIAKKAKIPTCMDNTYSTPLYFKPLRHGIDIVVYSLTKFVSGHSDLMGGAILANKGHFEKIYNYCDLLGNHVTSEVAYMMLRGIRTLPLRAERSRQSAKEIIEYLQTHPLIDKIYYPELPAHPGYEYFAKAHQGAPGLFTIVFKNNYSLRKLNRFFKMLQLFKMGYSYGGFESLIVTLNTVGMRKYSKQKPDDNKLHARIYIGLENPADLIADLAEGLDYLAEG